MDPPSAVTAQPGPVPYGPPPFPPIGGHAAPGASGAPKKSRTGLIIAFALLVLALAGGLAAVLITASDDDETVATSRTGTSTTTEDPLSPTTGKKKTTTSTTEKSTSSSDLLGTRGDTITVTGNSNTVVEFTNPSGDGRPFLITYEATGADSYSSLTIQGVDANGAENFDSIFATSDSNTISGTQLLNKYGSSFGEPTKKLKVGFDGEWKLQIKPSLAAEPWNGASPLAGTGPGVFLIDGELKSGVDIVTVFAPDSSGSSTFGNLDFLGPTDFDDSLSSLGTAKDGENTIPKSTILVTVDCNGGWTITPG